MGAAVLLDLDDLRLPDQVRITRDLVEQIAHDGNPKRIHFPTSHNKALKRNEGAAWVGKFSVPFPDTIGPMFREATGLELFPSKNASGLWRSIRDETEFEQIEDWITQQGTRVFLRDALALSVALDLDFLEESRYTDVGELEMRAKQLADRDAIFDLHSKCVEAIQEMPFYSKTGFIAAVPPQLGMGFDLPTCLARRVADTTGAYDLTPHFEWEGDKGSLSNEAVGENWEQLVSARLKLADVELKEKPIVLLDDLYRSGTKMQYVAMKLREAGAGPIFGLAVVKSWRDTDSR